MGRAVQVLGEFKTEDFTKSIAQKKRILAKRIHQFFEPKRIVGPSETLFVAGLPANPSAKRRIIAKAGYGVGKKETMARAR